MPRVRRRRLTGGRRDCSLPPLRIAAPADRAPDLGAGTRRDGVHSAEEHVAQSGRTRWDNVLTVSSATILVGTEVIAVAVAAAWAIAGLFQLGDIGEYALMTVFGMVGVYASFRYFRKAASIEPLRED